MDVGLLMLEEPGRAREIVRRAEAAGFAHLAFGDTQNLGPVGREVIPALARV
jgi:hypothetical protein